MITSKHELYTVWGAMIQRCTNPNRESWPLYGGRGIVVCDRWRKFSNFLEDMGERPPGYSLDRVNPNGNYERTNCRWIPHAQQAKTTRRYLFCPPCKDCGERRGNHAGRCHRCSEYFTRNGTPRPTEQAVVARQRGERVARATSKPVVQFSLDGVKLGEYASARAAAKACGRATASSINNHLNGRTKSACGYVWRFKTEEHLGAPVCVREKPGPKPKAG